MNNVLVTIAPAIDAFTSMYSPARSALSAMMSSVRLPSVALSNPPTAFARLCRDGFGGVAKQRGKRHDGQNGAAFSCAHAEGALLRLRPKMSEKTAKNIPADRPHIKIPVSASTP